LEKTILAAAEAKGAEALAAELARGGEAALVELAQRTEAASGRDTAPRPPQS
jgi:hypothetical protein